MNNNIAQFILQTMTNGQNPNVIINNMLNQHPQFQILFNQMKQSGMSVKEFTLQFAKQNNINLEPTLNLLSQRGVKL